MNKATTLRRRVLAAMGYGALFVGLLVLFSYLMFPYGRLRDYLVARVNSSQRGDSRLELRLATLSPAPLFGANVTGVQLLKHRKSTPGEPGVVKVDGLTASISPLALALGNEAFDFEASLGGGHAEGSFDRNSKFTRIEATLTGVDLEKVGIGGYLGFPLSGKATGRLTLALPEDPAQSNGVVELTVKAVSFGDGKAKLSLPGMRDGLTVERVDAGTLKINVEIEKGNAQIKTLEADGKDLLLDGSGSVKLASPLKRSRLNLAVKVKFSEAYKERDGKTKALFELMGFRPELKRAMTPDGSLRFELRGYLGSPRATPAGRSSRSRKSR